MATHKITGTSPASATTETSTPVAVGKYDAIRVVAVLADAVGVGGAAHRATAEGEQELEQGRELRHRGSPWLGGRDGRRAAVTCA